MAKNLFHSELVKMGPVQITVKSDVLGSKFPGKKDYVVLELEGETRNYTVENDECAGFFEGQKNRSFTIVAEGRDEEAVLTYVGEAAQEAPEPEPEPEPEQAPPPPPKKMKSNRPPSKPPGKKAAHRPPATAHAAGQGNPPLPPGGPPARATAPATAPAPHTNGKPAPETPQQRLDRARAHANRVANVYLVAYSAANFAREQVRVQFGQELNEVQFQNCVSTIVIQLEKDGFHHQMPTGIIHVGPNGKTPHPEPQPATA